MSLAALSQAPDSLERYQRALRFELEQKDLSRLESLPTGELVLLLSTRDGARKRVVVRIEDGQVSVSGQAADHFLPQAIVDCLLTHWIEYTQTGTITDPDHFDLFGSLDVLETFFSIQRLEQRPVSLRCRTMMSRRSTGARTAHR